MSDWVSEWVSKRASEGERTNETTNERANQRTNEQKNRLTDGWIVWGVIAAKILFQILLCRTCAVYKFFAENTRTEIEQTK